MLSNSQAGLYGITLSPRQAESSFEIVSLRVGGTRVPDLSALDLASRGLTVAWGWA